MRWTFALVSVATVLVSTGASAATETVRVATIFAKSSSWGQALNDWRDKVATDSAGRLDLQISYNGVTGSESVLVDKMVASVLDGAALTSVGLGDISKPILAMEMPGLFSSWARVDSTRAAMTTELNGGLTAAGYTNVGWFDVGVARLCGSGGVPYFPAGFSSYRPFHQPADFVMSGFFTEVSAPATSLELSAVYAKLNLGIVDTYTFSSLLAEELGWTAKVNTIADAARAYHLGGIVIADRKLTALPADLRTILLDSGALAAAAMTTKIRTDDAAAFTRAKAAMTVVTWTPLQKAAWASRDADTRDRLAVSPLSTTLVAKLEALATK